MNNYKEEAERLIKTRRSVYSGVLASDRDIALAQVTATLYLAEQQRIANLIAFLQIRNNYENGSSLFIGIEEASALLNEVGEALGIENGEVA